MTMPRHKLPRRGRQGTPVATLPDHRTDSELAAGEEARRLEFQEFCFGLHMRGWSHREIAQELAEKYLLDPVPSHPTIGLYIRGAVTHRKESIADMRDAYVAVTLPRLEQLIKNFLPIANGQGPKAVVRYKTIEGCPIEVIDEEGFKEAKEAAEVILKVTEQARKILGVGINEKGQDESKLTEARANTLIIQTVHNNFTGAGALKTIGSVAISSGDQTIDALEGGSSI